jgi:hypothetical protein
LGCILCGLPLRRGGEACSFARAWSKHERIFVGPAKRDEDSFPFHNKQQRQHPVIDLAELVSTKAGTISVAAYYSLTPPHVRLSRVHSQVIHHHSPSSHEQAFLP